MKLLVTGASGFLGWHLGQFAAQTWEVYGTGRSRSVNFPGVHPIQLDLTDFAAVKALFQDLQPDAVIHLAAQSQANVCEVQPEESYQLNVIASCNLAGLCADAQIPCVFTSTDLVFDGRNAPYRETDPVSPLNRYGEQKAQAEMGMLDRYPQAAICRMPLLFGDVPPHASSFLQPFIQTLREGKELRLFVDEFRTPVSGTTAAQGLLLALEQVQGLIHLGGKERFSRYEFGRLMVEILDLPAHGITACRQQDVKMAAPRPADVSLDSSKAFALGYQPPSIRAELTALKGNV
ncbi:MAG: NAD(P)-dependent oxidoreductase [Leptolyngbyaceae cyanobacterium bins.349]|nr:NAD(P)-dependent oxidoreductase [Leptolyngbyaceae cyanobacterium bins.349]